MPEWGVDEEGLSTPSYSDILDYYAKRWEEEFGTEADMSSRSPEGQFLRVIAEAISNKGLSWSDVTSLWDAIEDTYNSAFLATSSGSSLDHVVALRGLSRRTAQPAEGTLVFYVDEGEEIPTGTIASTQSGIEFETTRPTVANRYGIAPVHAEAIESGEQGNVTENTITQSSVGDVNNPTDEHNYHIGAIIDDWVTIPNDESPSKYQRISTKQFKYSTNVAELSMTFRATSGGLYAVQSVVMDDESGEVIYRTEVREKTLEDQEEWEVTFRGEDFDLLREPISDNIRVAPVNMSYSTDDVEIGLEETSTNAGWHDGVNPREKRLVANFKSTVNGTFRNGRSREGDVDLQNRFLNSLSRGGSTRPSAIESELYSIDSVKHVQILENAKAIDFRPEGLPPNSIEVVVWGGTNNEILQALLNARPAGVNTYGENIGTVRGPFGQVHQFKFSRAREVLLYVDITVVTSRTFPADGGERIKNMCAEIIGGEDLNSSFYPGSIGVGDTLYQSELESRIHNRVTGVKSVEAKLGREKGNVSDQDISMDDRETPIVKPDSIFIRRGQ